MTRRSWTATALASLSAGCVHRSRLKHPNLLFDLAPVRYHAEFQTTQGSFAIEVQRDLSPNGADRFYHLVRNGFYDGASFFRTLPKFVVQWGIPADPALAEIWNNARIPDDPVRASNTRGMITYAMAGPATRTTQVYVNMRDNSRLDKMGFSPFGRIVSGMEIFEKLHSGYGEGAPRGKGPSQDRIRKEGDAYLRKDFPLLDRITRAHISSSRSAPNNTTNP